MALYYDRVEKIDSIDVLRSIFPEGKANRNNWCLLSTSGVHGTYMSLDDLEHEEEWAGTPITALVIFPRTCGLLYGNIEVGAGDADWLRGLVASSVEAIRESQEGNLPDEVPA